MNIHDNRELTTIVVDVLDDAGLHVGRAHAPAGVPAGAGWAVVYPLTGGLADGTMDNPNDDASVLYQITSVGRTAEQAEWVMDTSRVAILSGTYALNDRKVLLVTVDMFGGVERDDDVQPPLFYAKDRYRFLTGPESPS